MRIDVHKYIILGPLSHKKHFFESAQRLGVVEFIRKVTPSIQRSGEVQQFIDALHVLRQMAPVEQAPIEDFGSANVLAGHVVELKDRLDHLQEKRRMLKKEIERIAIFGHFSLARLQAIEAESGLKIQFFFAKRQASLPAKQREEVIQVGSQLGMDYFVAINKQPTTYEGFVEITIDRSMGELEEELADVVRNIDSSETELGTLTHYKKVLQEGLINVLNQHHLMEAKQTSEMLSEGELFAVESWIPVNKVAKVQVLADALDIYIERVATDESDRIPTFLENKGAGRLGQDLVNIYDTPSIRDRDPSPWVFFSFAFFFSMIVGDAGYGLILLAVSLALLFSFKKLKGLGRRVLKLSCALSIGCIFWGIMTSSYLGISVPLDSPLRSISFVNWMVKQKAEYMVKVKPPAYEEWIKDFPEAKQASEGNSFLMAGIKKQDGNTKNVMYDRFSDNIMMELAIFVGAIHLIISFIRYLDRNWSGLGWIIFIIGGYLYFPLLLKATSLIHFVFHVPYAEGGTIGLYLVFIGIGLASVLAIVQNKLAGTAEVMQVISVFADVMSYLRIYALSLAGMIMGSTFNNIGMGMPFYIGIFIILAGHTINFTLALMGGVIHGLRLNFIEWYHYSFEGGGKNFSPLSLLRMHE